MISLEDARLEMVRRGKKVERLIALEKPELHDLFTIYQNEALESRKLLHNSLTQLKEGASLLEVGGGVLALATQLASEGYEVTTVEPVAKGFTEMHYIMTSFALVASLEKIEFNFVNTPIEDSRFDREFDFAFSINVMEHLKNPYTVLNDILKLIEHGGSYRFVCPNYDFPYEPHFAKWLFLRKNSGFYLSPKQARKGNVFLKDRDGLYESLNFITYKKIFKSVDKARYSFFVNQNALHALTDRALIDDKLQARHRLLSKVVISLNKLHLLKIVKLVPVSIQPTLDITVSSK